MSNYFSDRKSTYPNRYKVTPSSGSAYYATLERADEPTVVGTALNATVLNDLVRNLANLHVWEEYPSEPHGYSLGENTSMVVSRWGSTGSMITPSTASYADDFAVAEDGTVYLVNPSGVTLNLASESITELKGKFVIFYHVSSTSVYYYPPEAVLSVTLTSSGGISTGGICNVAGVYPITPDENGEHLAPVSSGYVCDFDESEYPRNGKQDGKWYVYHKRLGD